MLKITSILSSLFFLLFAVSGSYARTIAKPAQQQEASKKDKQEKNNDSEEDDKPVESAVQLDVFQAISLVNSQLRWKDFHAENARSSRLLFSSKKLKSEVRTSDASVEMFDVQSAAVVLPTISSDWIVAVWLDETITTSTFQRSLTIQENTIAFILNCGTYPTQQS